MTFYDECLDSVLALPTIAGYDVPLFSTVRKSFSFSSNNKVGCPDIYYELVVPNDAQMPNFFIDGSMQVTTSPDSFTNVGDYPLYINACI